MGAALQAGLLPLSRFDVLPESDRTEIIEYLRERDAMTAWEQQQAQDEMRKEQMRRK